MRLWANFQSSRAPEPLVAEPLNKSCGLAGMMNMSSTMPMTDVESSILLRKRKSHIIIE